jgi:hypothetical protein
VDAFRASQTEISGETQQRIDAAPGYLALAWGPSPRGGGLPLGVGIFADWPQARELRVTGSEQDTVDPSAVPDPIDPGGLDVFGEGVRREFDHSGTGSLWVLATGFAFGAGLTDWLRAGAGLVFERVQLAEQSTALTTYRAERAEAPNELYAASVQAEARFAGQADRLAPIAGFQFRPMHAVSVSVFARFPSRDLGGAGSVFLSQSSRAMFRSDTNPGVSLDELIVAKDEGLPFQLRTPLEVTFAVGFASNRFAFELDVERAHGLDTYTVLAVPESAPPSTTAYQPPHLRTGSQPVTRWAFGVTYAASDSAALAFGLRDDRSDVPQEDGVFRRVQLYTVSTGVIFQRGGFSGTVGVGYQFAPRQIVSFPSPLGESAAERAVQFEELALRVGASWLL